MVGTLGEDSKRIQETFSEGNVEAIDVNAAILRLIRWESDYLYLVQEDTAK